MMAIGQPGTSMLKHSPVLQLSFASLGFSLYSRFLAIT